MDELPAESDREQMRPVPRSASVSRTPRTFSPVDPADLHVILSLIADPSYDATVIQIRDWMAEALSARGDAMRLMSLQAELGKNLLALQDERRLLLRDRDDLRKVDRDVVDLRVRLAHANKAMRAIRDIGDGIAWRALSYDRLRIRALSSHHKTGAVEVNSLLTEGSFAWGHARTTGDITILNDLTNCLLFGDVTAVSPTRVAIAEVKGGRGSARSGKASRQKGVLDEKLTFINAGLDLTPARHTVRMIPTGVAARAHSAEVSRLLSESRIEGYAFSQLSESLAVQVVRPNLVRDVDPDTLIRADPFLGSPSSVRQDTLMLFDNWSKNAAPFSIFPYDLEDRTDVLMGRAVIYSYFDYGVLTSILKRRDLRLSMPSSEELEKLAQLRAGEIEKSEDAPIVIKRRRDRRLLKLSMVVLGRVWHEFLDDDSFADQIEAMFDASNVDGAYVPEYSNEHEMWD